MKPLVSCICVTANRRKFIGAALKSYLSQDWDNKELIVVDDGSDSVRDLCKDLPHCVYMYVAGPQKIGTKRNLACESASGSIICHWDDDDWSAPERIREQVRNMWLTGKAVSGYHSMLFWGGTRGFKYKGGNDYSLGTALCYRKDFWAKNRFIAEHERQWEDNDFVQKARSSNQISAVDAMKVMVARIHPGNTCAKNPELNPAQWLPVGQEEIPEKFFSAIGETAHAL